jgi:2-haloacid dehalogenase
MITADERHVLLFDVNETLLDLTALRPRFRAVGAPEHLLPVWFAGVLRDGFALTSTGAHAPFAEVAEDGLRALLTGLDGLHGDPAAAAREILAGLPELPPHPDVADGVRALHAAGHRMLTLTNGSRSTAEAVLGRAGLAGCFQAHLDVEGPRCWKPGRASYAYAVGRAGVEAARLMLVSVHPWDIDGADRAGLSTAWISRGSTAPYPRAMRPPTCRADSLTGLLPALDEAR